jgi:NADPH-dependent 2,4-dienoyl-CoA reductase/sulfur reductase-like enzyme
MPPAMREGGRLVVVGGNAAGLSAASRARRLRPDVEIVVLECGHDVSYAACMLPYYIAGVSGPRESLIVYDADFFRRERKIDLRLGAEATEIKPRARSITFRLEDGDTETIGYDALVLATGSRPIVPPIPGSEMPGVFVLRTLEDGDAIKSFVDRGCPKHVVILGAGYIGLEMAESLKARGLEVTVIERLPSVLSTYDPDMSEIVERELHSKGVRVLTGTSVDGFEKSDDTPCVAYALAGGQRLSTDMVVLAAGVRPRSEIAGEAGLELGVGGAIRVDARQVTSDPSILAAGDCSEATHIVTGKKTWIPLGTTANKQGKIAGENAVGGAARFQGVAGTNVTKIMDLEVAQTGLTETRAREEGLDVRSVSITASSKAHAYPGGGPLRVKLVFEGGTGRLLGAQMAGEDGVSKRIDTVAAGLTAGMSVSELAAVDMSYAPPFSPVWDPVLIAANQAVKKVRA